MDVTSAKDGDMSGAESPGRICCWLDFTTEHIFRLMSHRTQRNNEFRRTDSREAASWSNFVRKSSFLNLLAESWFFLSAFFAAAAGLLFLFEITLERLD